MKREPQGRSRQRVRLWPLYRRVEQQARLFGEMMERVEVDPAAAARVGHGVAFAAASRRCLACGSAGECGRWLDNESSRVAPAFCPNADFLTQVQRSQTGA